MSKDKSNMFVMKRAIISILIITSTLILVDLYVPLKRILGGDKLTFMEAVSYINIGDQFSSILAIGMFLSTRSANEEKDSTIRGNKQ